MKSVHGETTYWTCRQKDSKKCSARATTILVVEEVFAKSLQVRFPSMWNVYERVLNDEPTTNNTIESWNAKWNNAHRANHNVARVVTGFKTEDALAQSKLQQQVAGTLTNPNPGRSDKRAMRLEQLKMAMSNYQRSNIKDYMFGLRNHV